ncbi:MAG: chromosome segregation protein SMC [Pseudomonadota bacterium]
MRLTSIKLSGFKSFVDPTNFQVPGQLVGVVGPNGCGKSNIIDAVRWVLGESKASELRGESMQDVIFNGTTHRKPAGRSSVELAFDNSEGKAAGQWHQYAEIAVKRTLTRDGTSTYYINNQPVRRRDIQDIFMGTGLGPRAYAIIGQGMISRIIEARPEELRIFLEEAAGVSKYKERRRETENRLNDTRENLVRVDDIVRELSTNLDKLQSQAEVARRFQALQADQSEKQALLWLLRRNEAINEQARFLAQIDQAQTALESSTASLRSTEAALEALRQRHYAAGDQVHQAQGCLYQTNAEIGSLETQIRFVNDSRVRLQTQLTTLAAQRDQWLGQCSRHMEELAEAEMLLHEQAMQVAESAEVAVQQQERVPALEHALRDAQLKTGESRAKIMQARQQLEMESARQRNAMQLLAALTVRRERLVRERGELQLPDESHFENLTLVLAEKQVSLKTLQHALQLARDAQPTLEQSRTDTILQATNEGSVHAQLDARLSALTQLQESVQTKEKLRPWLEKHALHDLPRLWQRLQVTPGWENALEAVLRERTNALEIADLDQIHTLIGDAPPAKLTLFMPAGVEKSASIAPPEGLRPLIDLLKIGDAGVRGRLQGWLSDVYVVDDIDAALKSRLKLPVGACFVTRAGHIVGCADLRFHAPDSPQEGMLARQTEIENLVKQVRVQLMLAEAAHERSQQADLALRENMQQSQQAGQQIASINQLIHSLQLDLLKISEHKSRFEQRQAQIDIDLEEISGQEDEQQLARGEHEARFEELEAVLSELLEMDSCEQTDYLEKEQRLNEARLRLREAERLAQEAAFAERSQRNRIAELQRNVTTAQQQAAHASANLEQANMEFASLNDDAAQVALQALLGGRVEQESRLSDARQELDQLTQTIRQHEDARSQAERSLQPQRDQIVELQLKEQAARLNQEQFALHLTEAGIDEIAMAAKLTPDMRPSYLQGEVTRLANLISALGAVNLAALEELDQASERKNFLDAQTADLTAAINTLQDAIHKIDHETRDLLQETFDKVNQHFSELFPILFGGGTARLIMTGDEILDAGVQVMAQPPGKKNATIHLLSGGEKALTATALVFSMFQLNPAPFCLLDEVDAPLDDANTERFCSMVKRMAQKTQFLFISHNKIAMEMAHQLIGVTMQEQGVSRIVAVDMEAARHFVAEAAAA